jgi:diaminohydroxyphosphoribosylaminopyrimidine deaminase/5-amino-6-(5-phosphoribosylamino)uracil reductase
VHASRNDTTVRRRILEAGVGRVVVGVRDPNLNVSGGGVERLRDAGVDVEVVRRGAGAACARPERGLPVRARARPAVGDLQGGGHLGRADDGAGQRWVSGEESRRRVHELRAWVDAVAVGMGTARADAPRLDARGVDAPKQPRRIAFGHGPLPEGSELELRSGPLEDELRALAQEGVQTLLLEGGATLAASVLRC